jgi:hypothetical protein
MTLRHLASPEIHPPVLSPAPPGSHEMVRNVLPLLRQPARGPSIWVHAGTLGPPAGARGARFVDTSRVSYEGLREKLVCLAGCSYGIPAAEAGAPVAVAMDRWSQSEPGGAACDGLRALVKEFHRACEEYLVTRGGAWPAGSPGEAAGAEADGPLTGVLRRPGSPPLLRALADLSPETRDRLQRLLEARRSGTPPAERP